MVGITLKLEDDTILTYETLTTDESPEGDEMDPTVVSAGGLRIHTIERLTKYRVVFSGAQFYMCERKTTKRVTIYLAV